MLTKLKKMIDNNHLVCNKCKVPLEMRKVTFGYLKHNFYGNVPACPRCGQVFISEDIVKGKVREVEQLFEDK